LPTSHSYDSFKQIHQFTPLWTDQIESSASLLMADKGWKPVAKLGLLVTLPENKTPLLLLKAVSMNKSWLSLRRVAVLVGDKLVVDRGIAPDTASSELFLSLTIERSAIVLTHEEIASLRAIRPSDRILIRLAGRDSNVAVEQSDVEHFRNDLGQALRVYDRLTAALPAPVK
jgi:hypothetical protein